MATFRRAAGAMTMTLGWAALSAHALAQEAPAPAAEAKSPQAAIETIVVTGEKVDQDLQKTVSSVAVVSGEQIEDEGLTSLAEVFDYVANVNMGNTGGGFSIRGIPFDSLLGAGSAPLAQIYVDDATMGDQATRFNADQMWDVAQIEVLRGAQSTVQGRNALAGAVVIRTQEPTSEWTGKARLLGQSFENGDAYTASVAGGGPIIRDVLAFRVSAERSESDGHVSNPVLGLKGADFNDHTQVRAKLLFEPTADIKSLLTISYSDAWVADAVSDRRSRDANGYVNLTDVVPGNESRRETFENVPDYNRSTIYNYVWKTDWQATDALTLTSISTYADETIDEKLDTDGTNLDPAIFPQTPFTIQNPYNIPHVRSGEFVFEPAGTQYEEQTIGTQELTASWDNGGQFRGLAGAYYAGAQEREYNFTPGLQTGLFNIIDGATRPGIRSALISNLGPLRGIPAPGNPVAGIPAGAAGDAAFNAFVAGSTDLIVGAIRANYSDVGSFIAMTSEPLDVENFAVYVRGEYDFTEQLTVGGGLRYDNERQTEGLVISGDPLGLPNPANPTLPAGFPAAFRPFVQSSLASVNGFFNQNLQEASTESKQRFEAVLPSAFIRYAIDQDRSLAFSVRRGYRAGGADLNIVRQFVSTFDPEYTTNYELAFRSYWFDRALRVNANAFYTDWTDQQVVVSLSTLQQDEIGFNVGKSTLMGFETDTLWQITDEWSVQGVLGYVKTEFQGFDAALAEAVIAAQSLTAPIDLEETLAAFEGRAFSFAPEWSGAARLIYRGDSGLFGTLGITYEGESFVNNSNSGSATFLHNDARALVNLTAGYEFGPYTVSFIGQNLLDEEYVSSGGNERVRLGAPRTLGLQLQASF